MSEALAKQQKALARLYTDAPLRARFSADPASVALELELPLNAAESLGVIAKEGLALFAESLFRKRFGALRSLAPVTHRLFRERLRAAFRQFVNENSGHPETYVHDLANFSRWLHRNRELQRGLGDAAWMLDVIRFEAAAAAVWRGGARMRMIRLSHDIREHLQGRGSAARPAAATLLCVWLRTGRRVRHIAFRLPRRFGGRFNWARKSGCGSAATAGSLRAGQVDHAVAKSP